MLDEPAAEVLKLVDGKRSVAVIVDVLKTHPKVLIGNMVIENPFYVEPDEFLARHRTGW